MTSWRFALGRTGPGVFDGRAGGPGRGAQFDLHRRATCSTCRRRSDPQISPDGRQIAYVRLSRRHHDRHAPGSTHLADRHRERPSSVPLVAGTGSHISPRWSPDGTPPRLRLVSRGRRLAAVRPLDGQRRRAARITGLPDSPERIAWSPDGRRIAYVMIVPDEGLKLGSAPRQAGGREMGQAARDHRQGHLPRRRRRLSEARLRPDLHGRCRRRRAAPADLRRYHDGGPLEWTPDGRAILFSAIRKPDWERDGRRQRNLPRSTSAAGALTALTSRDGPDLAPDVSPDGRQIAYLGFDDRRQGVRAGPPLRDEPATAPARARSRRASTAASTRSNGRRDGRSVYRRLRRGRLGDASPASASTAASARSPTDARRRRARPALCRRRVQRRRATARSPSPPATYDRPADVAVVGRRQRRAG